MSRDPFASLADSAGQPARAPYAISPSDTDALPLVPKAIYVGTGGTVTVRGVDGGAVAFRNVASGQVIDVRAGFVLATGTTAADLVALV